MDQLGYATNVFHYHCERTGLKGNLQNLVILELGPGDSIATAIIAATYNAKAILVDSGDYASKDIKSYISLTKNLRILGHNPPNLSRAKNIDDILSICNATYYTAGLSSLRTITKNSVDFIFSHAVLEHVREHEFLQTMFQCKRILKDNGFASHRVDLKDHLGGGLNNLRFSRKVWESDYFVKSGFYTNRIRFSHMIHLMKKANFEIISNHVDRWNAIPISRNYLTMEFAQMSDEDLLINGFDVVLR